MTFELSKDGYEPFLDYLKGICIIMVVINHGFASAEEKLLFPIWIHQAVPIFLLIQVFHSYKKTECKQPSVKKIFHRIILPFFWAELILFFAQVFIYYLHNLDYLDIIKGFIQGGGSGPGSYYIWIYLQFAFLLPLLYPLVKKKYSCILFILISETIEILCSYFSIPDDIYRLLCIRYIFLVYLGYLWVKNGISKRFFLSTLSIIAILILYFTHKYYLRINFQPFIFNTNWTIFHWFTYFLPWSLIAYYAYRLYKQRGTHNKIIIMIGKSSYEIFLTQMVIFGAFPTFPFSSFIKVFLCFSPILLLYLRRKYKKNTN